MKEAFGSGWVGPTDARMVLVGEAFGREEEIEGEPFVGSSGKELWRMLGEAIPQVWPEEHMKVQQMHRFGNSWIRHRKAWLYKAGIAFTNVLNFRPPDNKISDICVSRSGLPSDYTWPAIAGPGKYLNPIYLPEVHRLHYELKTCHPNLVVPMGATAAWAIVRTASIGSIRGSTGIAPTLDLKALPTFHPASVLYQWSQRPIVVADLIKSWRESQFPEIIRPKRLIKVDPDIHEVQEFVESAIQQRPNYISCDTETSLGLIDTISFATDPSHGLVCQVGPHRERRGTGYTTIWPVRNGQEVVSYWSFDEEVLFWKLSFRLLESGIPLVFQNGVYDLQYLIRMGCRPKCVSDDPMLLSHSLFPELRKGLGFLGSIYTDEFQWKLMRRSRAETVKYFE